MRFSYLGIQSNCWDYTSRPILPQEPNNAPLFGEQEILEQLLNQCLFFDGASITQSKEVDLLSGLPAVGRTGSIDQSVGQVTEWLGVHLTKETIRMAKSICHMTRPEGVINWVANFWMNKLVGMLRSFVDGMRLRGKIRSDTQRKKLMWAWWSRLVHKVGLGVRYISYQRRWNDVCAMPESWTMGTKNSEFVQWWQRGGTTMALDWDSTKIAW